MKVDHDKASELAKIANDNALILDKMIQEQKKWVFKKDVVMRKETVPSTLCRFSKLFKTISWRGYFDKVYRRK